MRSGLYFLPLLTLLAILTGCAPAVSSVSPPSVAAGGPAFTLTVLGSGFSSGSTVQWNGSPRSTQYVSTTELLAQISAADIAATGTAAITVTNPQGLGGSSGSGASTGSGGGTTTGSTAQSNRKSISIVSPSIDATAFQIDPTHDGAVTFGAVSFPSLPTWRVSLGTGAPSNIVIADGKVFLTTGAAGGSQLLALTQANGATAWGPEAIAGVSAGAASVAYDGGRVFVSGGSTLYAYDAATGALDWSTSIGAAGAGAPTAANGLVFINMTGTSAVYALDQATGAIAWQRALPAVSRISAVTADGLYLIAATSGCQTLDLRPATGEIIWHSAEGTGLCPQYSSDTPVVSNQLVYAPNSSGTSIFAAETGSSAGTLADPLPAAFTGSTAYFPQGANLDAVDLSNSTVAWTFNGDGTRLTTVPIVIDQYVITGTAAGNLYAVDAGTGAQAWTQALGGQVRELSAGDGWLLVIDEPASGGGGTLTAYAVSSSP